MAVMTANVAQVFLEDQYWENTLIKINESLNNRGHLVFEVRDPSQKAWLSWTRENTFRKIDIPGIGLVEGWCELIEHHDEWVSFRWNYKFHSDGEIITSDSTLRFRSKESIESSLDRTGYLVKDVRDAPDRLGKEFVFIAHKK